MNDSLRDRAFGIVSYVFIGVFALFCFLPFWMMISGSFTKESELILNGYSLFPESFSTTAYTVLLQSKLLWSSYVNTALITVVGTALALFISAMLAYSLANGRNTLRGGMLAFVYFPMLFYGGLIPFYITVSKYLHLSNTLWAVILPLVCQPFLVFLMVNFFRTLPKELEESARIDGAHEFNVFIRIMIPISKPILATVALFYALGYWNDWFMSLLFIDEESKYPLQLILRRMVSNLEAAKSLIPSNAGISIESPLLGVRMSTTIVTIGPIVLLYPLLQKYFVKGLTIGAVKG